MQLSSRGPSAGAVRLWSRRRAISFGLGAGAGLALGSLLAAPGARAQAPVFDVDVGSIRHSQADVGTSGFGVGEYQHTLDVALRVKAMLEGAGLSVALTRTDHAPLSPMSHPDPIERVRIEQTARIAAVGNARIYVSLHFDGAGSPSVRGTETFYNADNHGEDSKRLAEAIQRHMVDEIRALGYPTVDRGANDDLRAGKPYGHFFMLRGGMPSVCGEPLFLTNPTEGTMMLQEETRQAVARGYAGGIVEYFAAGA
ncbi:MAG: N-acetylmuramoyl-L-alanine amidase [Chloroflexota bacterium]